MSKPVVLDACALLAYFNDEEGAEQVEVLLRDGRNVLMSAVNVYEVVYDAIRTTQDSKEGLRILEALSGLGIRIEWNLTPEVLLEAARYKTTYRISLADSIALGLAEIHAASLATCDHHEFEPIVEKSDADVCWIR